MQLSSPSRHLGPKDVVAIPVKRKFHFFGKLSLSISPLPEGRRGSQVAQYLGNVE